MTDRPESDDTATESATSEQNDQPVAESSAAGKAAGGSDTKDQAVAMRELLSSKREAEQLRGEASRLREEAATEAERLVSQAQELAAQLVDEARTEADLMGDAARSHADALTSGAEEEALRMRKEVAEEVAATRLRAEAAQRVQLEEGRRQIREAVQEAASSVGDLKARLSSALESISAVESRLGELSDAADLDTDTGARAGAQRSPSTTARVLPPPSSPEPSPAEDSVAPSSPTRSGPVVIETRPTRGSSKLSSARVRTTTSTGPPEPEAETTTPETAEGRPLGWLFRASER